MKKWICSLLLVTMLLGMTACGGEKAPAKVELQPVYEGFQAVLPEMMVLNPDDMLNFFGIQTEDCAQVITAICADGLAADEVWLIQAKDADGLARLEALANARIADKIAETENYLPDQYVIVKQGQIVVKGLYLALLVSPEVETMKSQFEAAVQ